MTRTTNVRIAGLTFLSYIAVAITGMALFDRATSAEGTAASSSSTPPRSRSVAA
ncbi:MAG TPA: hypothetical protein VMS86_06695 [Thermoanaerobaculia bacterium]|nr:hypothetical protein [Thermoanaerobaculia bacterium]